MSFIFNFLQQPAGIFYLLIFLLVFISSFEKNKILDLLSVFFVFLFSLIFLGLRDKNSGTDTDSYVYAFNQIHSFEKFKNWDFLYYTFAFVISKVGNSNLFIFLNVLVQLILIYFSSKLLKIRNKSLILLAYISFLPGFDMLNNGLRQGFSSSLAILFFVLSFYKNKIPKLSLIVVLFLHKSTLPYLIYCFVKKILKHKTVLKTLNFLVIAITCLFIVWHFIDFSNVLSNLLSTLSFQLFDSGFTAGDKLNAYLLNTSDTMLQGIYKYYFTFISLYFLFHFILFKKKIQKWEQYTSIINLWFLTFILTGIYALLWISPYSYRFMYIMFLPGLLSSVLTLEQIKNKYYYLLFFGITLIAGILTYGSNTYASFNLIF